MIITFHFRLALSLVHALRARNIQVTCWCAPQNAVSSLHAAVSAPPKIALSSSSFQNRSPMAHHNRPEENAAQWRRQHGISRVNAVPRDDRLIPHPAGGGSHGYPIIFRHKIFSDYQLGRTVLASMMRSVFRWMQRELPHRMTGN